MFVEEGGFGACDEFIAVKVLSIGIVGAGAFGGLRFGYREDHPFLHA